MALESVIKAHALCVKARRAVAQPWRESGCRATEPGTVDRVPAWLVAASAVRSPSVRFSTPIPARPTPQCHRNTRYGSVLPVTEVLPSGRMNSVGNRSGWCPESIRAGGRSRIGRRPAPRPPRLRCPSRRRPRSWRKPTSALGVNVAPLPTSASSTIRFSLATGLIVEDRPSSVLIYICAQPFSRHPEPVRRAAGD